MNTRLFAVPAAALLLAACAAPAAEGDAASGGGEPLASASPTSDAVAGGGGETSAPTGEADADNVFAFTAQTVDGQEFDGLSIDDRDVVLWFWAPWCPTCQMQTRTINAALPDMPEGVDIVGIAGLSDDLEYMQEFVSIYEVDGMTHVADLDGDVYRRFEITQQSTLLFIDDSGDAWLGGPSMTADDIVARAEELAAS
ncbi:redoxin domain-containing protein [Demequina sp. NBRC 110052]|uniref:redoxin domain-containing protein n=1 Tax=Demequina sp. NBRC 110052 TaxID=1570341 RepID=UPI000A01A7CA|nr:redoxin domain-containing protein [Demequina sp. NBRC 110052]